MKNILISRIKRLIFLNLILLISGFLSAQPDGKGNPITVSISGRNAIISLVDRQAEILLNSYSSKNESPEELINGKEYESYYTRSKVKPLLFPGKSRTATLITKKRRYNDLVLQYDTYLDEVIYTDTSKTINFRFPQISLNKDNLTGFNLYFNDDSLIFRYFRLPECSGMKLKEGFYEVAYEGVSRYLIKHQSLFYEKEGLFNYKYSPVNYISDGNEFFPVKKKRDLLRLMDERSKDVKKFLRASRVRISQANKDQIVSVLRYCESLLRSDK